MSRHVCAYVAPPVLTGRPVRTTEILAAWRVVKHKESCAAILRMQLVAVAVFAVDVIGNAHAEHVRPHLGIVAVEYQHVATAAPRLLEESAGRRSWPGWRHHFEKAIRPNGKEDVLRAVLRDASVAVAFFDAEQSPNQRRGGIQVRCDEADLAQAQIGPHLSGLQRRACTWRQRPRPPPCGRPWRRTGFDCSPPVKTLGE